MPERNGYEVIKLIERGNVCYAAIDYAEGMTLLQWTKLHKQVEKEVIARWLKELVRQLSMFHRQKGTPVYHCLTPSNIIINDKGSLALLSQEKAGATKRNGVEKHFVPPDDRQNADVYCLGKLIQFVMAHLECEPHLTKREEHKLLKLVRMCLESDPKKQIKSIQVIQNQFTEKNRRMKKSIVAAVLAVFCFSVLLCLVMRGNESEKESGLVLEEQKEETDTELNTEPEFPYLEAGMDYFLEMGDYEKSLKCFQKVRNTEPCANDYIQLTQFMLKRVDGETAEEHLENRIREMRQERKDIREVIMLARVCAMLDTQKGYEMIVELDTEVPLSLPEKLKREYEEYRALAYEKLETWEKAAAAYGELAEKQKEEEEKSHAYGEKVMQMQMRYLEELWKDGNLEMEKRLEEVKRSVERFPAMKENEAFLKFTEEKKIKMEGEKIWVEEN